MTKEQIAAVDERIKGLKEWLQEVAPECFTEQKHIRGREFFSEKVYWHYGYLLACRDLLRLEVLEEEKEAIGFPEDPDNEETAIGREGE